MNSISIAAYFVRNLGSQRHLLRKVTVDAGPLCLESCAGQYGVVDIEQIDILPLVRLLWAEPENHCGIELVHSGRILDRRVHPFENEQDLVNKIYIILLDVVIEAIGSHDALGIKRFGRFQRTIDNIWIP